MSDQVERFGAAQHPNALLKTSDGPYVRYSDHRSVVERLEGERDKYLELMHRAKQFAGQKNGERGAALLERDQATALIHKAIEEFERRAEGYAEETVGPFAYRDCAAFLRDLLSSPPEP